MRFTKIAIDASLPLDIFSRSPMDANGRAEGRSSANFGLCDGLAAFDGTRGESGVHPKRLHAGHEVSLPHSSMRGQLSGVARRTDAGGHTDQSLSDQLRSSNTPLGPVVTEGFFYAPTKRSRQRDQVSPSASASRSAKRNPARSWASWRARSVSFCRPTCWAQNMIPPRETGNPHPWIEQ